MENNMQTALITGATSGIGFELAKLFAGTGYNLVIVARNEQELQHAAAELSRDNQIEVKTIASDLSKPESANEVYNQIKSLGIQVDVLVNDAGQGYYGEFKDTDIDREIEIIQLNIIAYIALTKLFLKDMLIRNEGKILNVGSIAGEAPGPWHSVYHGTKAFVNSWTAAIQYELKDTDITVTALLPGPTDTDFFNKADMQESKIVDTNLGDPAEVAKDGFEALMSGDSKITSGFKNKAQVAMANLSTDSMAAQSMAKQQEPKTE